MSTTTNKEKNYYKKDPELASEYTHKLMDIVNKHTVLDDTDSFSMASEIYAFLCSSETIECVLCKESIVGFGNNPQPVADKGKCCDRCNGIYVIPLRVYTFMAWKKEEEKKKNNNLGQE